MSNIPEMLGQVTRGSSLRPSRANPPAGLPTVAIEQPNLQNVDPLLWESSYNSGLKSAKATKTKNDDKTSVSSAGISWDSFTDIKVDDMNLNGDEIITVDRLVEMEAEEEQRIEEAYIKRPVAEGASRKGAINHRIRNKVLDSLTTLHVEQLDGDIYLNDLLRARSLERAQGYLQPEVYGTLPPHRNTGRLLCRLRSTHYTISQDHTSGQKAYEDDILASFGKRRCTEKPFLSFGNSILLQRSPSSLTSSANGSDVVAHNRGAAMQELSKGDYYLDKWQPVRSKMPKDAVSLPGYSVPPTPGFAVWEPLIDRKERRDKVEFGRVQKQERSRRVPSPTLQRYLFKETRDVS